MAKTTWKCNKCNIEKETQFVPGKVVKPVCEKCGQEMSRIFKENQGCINITTEETRGATDMLLYSSTKKGVH